MPVHYRLVTVRHAFGWREFTTTRRVIVSDPGFIPPTSEEDIVPVRTSPALPAVHIDRPLWPTVPSRHSGGCVCGRCPSCRTSERPEYRATVRSYLTGLLRQVAQFHPDQFDLTGWDGLVHDGPVDRPHCWVRLSNIDGTTWLYDDNNLPDLIEHLTTILATPATV